MAPESCDIITAVRQTLRGVPDESTRCADHPLLLFGGGGFYMGGPMVGGGLGPHFRPSCANMRRGRDFTLFQEEWQ